MRAPNAQTGEGRPPSQPLHARLGACNVALWTVAFVVHRAAVLLWGFNGLFYWEETYRLLVAEALLGGWRFPLLDLQADPYAGGSLVISTLAAPVVALVGPSVVGLKVVALLWSAIGFVAWVILVDRYWGRRAAHYFAFAFVFAPPLFVVYNLIAMGSHAEVVTLGGIQLLLAYRYLYGGERRTGALVLWAAVAGLGTWFTYVASLPFIVCLAVGLVGRALPPRRWPAVALGFVCGLGPWILTNIASGGRGLDVVARTFGAAPGGGPRSPRAYGAMVFHLLHKGVALGLQFRDAVVTVAGVSLHLPRWFFAHAYLALYAGSWIALVVSCVIATAARPARRSGWMAEMAGSRPEVPLLLLFPVFIVVVAGTDQIFLEHELVPFLSFRLLVPFLPAFIWALAVEASRLRPPWQRRMIVALAVLGVAGTAQVLAAGSGERPRLEAQARNLGAQAMGHLLFYKHGADMPLIAERIAAMPDELRPAAYEGLGFSVAYHYPESQPIAGFVAMIMQIAPPHRVDVVRGVRTALGPGMEQVKAVPSSPRTRAMLDAVETLDPANR